MKRPPPTSYIHPALVAGRWPDGSQHHVYASAPIREGELLCVWGGIVLSREELFQLDELTRRRSLQVDEDLYLSPTVPGDIADLFNHSCDPNAGLSGQIALIALRDIGSGVEVCYDYAMSDGSDYDEFECACGSPLCRGRITGDDWRRPEIQERYRGHLSPYLERRVRALRRG